MRLLLFILCSFFSTLSAYQYDLSICTIFRDEAPYLKEWIEYHRLLGVQHFYLCNHSSQDNYYEVLNEYIDNGIVELENIIEEEPNHDVWNFVLNYQCTYFTRVLERARGESKWVAFMDSDEFWVPHKSDTLIEFLRDYEHCGAIAAHWLMFGTSYCEYIPAHKLMIQCLRLCNPNHEHRVHIKSIVQPEKAELFDYPHYPVMKLGEQLVEVKDMQVNHYWTRDEWYFEEFKLYRQRHFGHERANIPAMRQWAEDMNKVEDGKIDRFIPELRKRLGLQID